MIEFVHAHKMGFSFAFQADKSGRLQMASTKRHPKDTPNRRVAVEVLRQRLADEESVVTFECHAGAREFAIRVRELVGYCEENDYGNFDHVLRKVHSFAVIFEEYGRLISNYR